MPEWPAKKRRRCKHGGAIGVMSSAYRCWLAMRERCERKQNSAYSCYGGRGILVCERWQDFANFQADMGDPPPGHTLDRIDNDGNYEPGNCRWATRKEQSRNMRTNCTFVFKGKTQCVSAWAEEFGFKRSTLQGRLERGWPIERALLQEVK